MKAVQNINPARRARIGRALLAAGVCLAIFPTLLPAAPTQEEVFRSINQNVGQTVDFRRLVPFALAAAGLVILLVLYNHRRQHQVVSDTLNHPGKLMKEIGKALNLKPVEIKQLRLLAEDEGLASPLTLLTCPSTLGKAMKAQNPKVDREVLTQVVGRLRE